ncbi:MAG: hypothetical protein KDE09_25115 [Anaerolineales bacterium]|nr:hypothetical protein [Anaerolineales bacterium]MCB0028688.1 hypothetical protein [Anaerolineales bacterium]
MKRTLRKAARFIVALLILGSLLLACSADENSESQGNYPASDNVDPSVIASSGPGFVSEQQTQSTPATVNPVPKIEGTLVDLGIDVDRETTSVFANPVWSHDGDAIVFTRPGPHGGTHILVDTETWSQETEIFSIDQYELCG